MTALEALALHASVQDLLAQQAALFAAASADLDQAGRLGDEITRLLGTLPGAERLSGLDQDLRARLLASARCTEQALAAAARALASHRQQRQATQVRAERDGAAVRGYLPAAGGEPARYLDERR